MNSQVVLNIIATGEVGAGKSRALEVIVNALNKSKVIKVTGLNTTSFYRTEVKTMIVEVTDPHKSKE